MALSIDDKLGHNRFHADHETHIVLKEDWDDTKTAKQIVLGCPAQLYHLEDNGSLRFNHEGCLECGTCRVLSQGRILKSWDHPVGGMGVEFRMG